MKAIPSILLASVLFIVSCQKNIKEDLRPPQPQPTTPGTDTTATNKPQTYAVNTVAGAGTAGFRDGNGDSALFNRPKGIAIDATGNLYIGDWGNNRIRKITPDNIVSTLAGNGKAGYGNGIATAARFNQPGDVAVDQQGNVYVADLWNNRIRKISPEGVVTTLAGNGKTGYVNGSSDTARFNTPRGIAVDGLGNIYVSDMNNHSIRKITPDGMVSTLAGNGKAGHADGKGSAAQFNKPRSIAIDADGNLYIADTDNNCIRKISQTGEVTTLAGSVAGYADGTGANAKLNKPKGITCDKNGILYISDTENNRIRKITPDGVVATIAGNGTAGFANGNGIAAQFKKPRAVAIDNNGKNLYIVDQDNNRIRKIIIQ